MITENMQLNSTRDASTWASNMGLNNAAQETRVAQWIWENKPHIGCTIDEHPLNDLSENEFWEIAGDD